MSIGELISASEDDLRRPVLDKAPAYWKPHFENRLEQLCRVEKPKIWMILSHIELAFGEKFIAPSLSELALRDFAERISTYGGIDGVYVRSSGDEYDVWTVIEEFDDQTEDKIAEAELQLTARYPNMKFDFMLLRRHGRPVSELVPDDSKLLYPR